LEDQVFTGVGYWQEFKRSYDVFGFVGLLFALVTGTTTWVAIWIIGKGIYRVKGNVVWNWKIADPVDA